MSNASSIQRFVPRLVAELEVLDLPDGDSAVCARDVHYARLSPSDRRLFAHMDGERDLAAIVRDASESGKLVSIRQLLAVVKRLAEAGALDNATGELESYELLPKPPSLARRLGRGLLTTRLEVGALGRGLGWALGWMRGVRLSATGWASYILVGATICAYLRWKSPSVVDPLRVGSSYALGLVLVYAGVAAALTAREVAKLLVLVGYGVRVHAAGLTARLGLLWAPSVDARHIIRAGRGGERELAAAGLAGPVLILTAIIVRWKVAFMPAWLSGLQVMAWGAAVVCWANACPLLPTDLGRLIDAMRDDSQGRRHALAYMSQRLLRRQGKSEFFEGESALVAVALAAVAWLYAGFLLGTSALSALLPALRHAFDEDVTSLDRAAVLAAVLMLTCLIVGSALALVAVLVRFALGLLPKRSAQGTLTTTDAEAAARIIGTNPVFSTLEPSTLATVAGAAKTLRYKRGEAIVRHGERGDTFFVVAEGSLDVVAVADSGLESVVASLGAGDGFGEMALIEDAPRNATIRARTPATVIAVGKSEFHSALAAANVSSDKVTALLRATSALRRSDVFASLSPRALLQVIGRAQREERAQGDVIMKEGDVGDRFYVVESGSVLVQDKTGEQQAALGPGQVFGEIALMRNVPRTATVVCAAPSVLARR